MFSSPTKIDTNLNQRNINSNIQFNQQNIAQTRFQPQIQLRKPTPIQRNINQQFISTNVPNIILNNQNSIPKKIPNINISNLNNQNNQNNQNIQNKLKRSNMEVFEMNTENIKKQKVNDYDEIIEVIPNEKDTENN
jgi:hypothetical protein